MVASLRNRLLRSTLAIVVAMAAVLGIVSGSLFSAVARDEEVLRLQRQAEILLASVSDRRAALGVIAAGDLTASLPSDEAVILRSAGRIVAQTPALTTSNTVSVVVSGPDGVTLTLVSDGGPLDRRVHNAWLLIAATGVLVVAAAAGLAEFQARRLSRPLTRLAAAAAQMGAGDFSMEAPRSNLIELDALANALDQSAHQIATLVRSEREFSANASHQLRSPLTAISLRLELISSSSHDAVARAEAIAALDELHGLDQRIDDLLQLARTGRVAESKVFDVAALVRRHADSIRPRFQSLNRRLAVDAPSTLEVTAVAGAVGQAVEILIDNALLHGSGDVHAAVRRVDSSIEIEIRDGGVIHNIDPGDTDGGPSHGVGLVLARSLLRGDGGTVDLTNSAPTTFVIRLPLSHPSTGETSAYPAVTIRP
jgi:signal transduction histidine kinase